MSITQNSTRSQQHSRTELSKATSCPEPFTIHSPETEKEKETEQVEDKLQSLQLGGHGLESGEVFESRRMGQRRLESMKPITKKMEGLNQSTDPKQHQLDHLKSPIQDQQYHRTSLQNQRVKKIPKQLSDKTYIILLQRIESIRKHLLKEQFGMAPQIPKQLSSAERDVYKKLLDYRQQTSKKPTRVVVITDLAKDYDDLSAMVLLKELERLGFIELVGFVANLYPAYERAVFGRLALDLLGLQHVPIACGEEAEANLAKRKEPNSYEFKDCDFMKDASKVKITESGFSLLDRLIDQTIAEGAELTVLALSGLADLATYTESEPLKFAKAVHNVNLQGSYSVDHDTIIPDLTAANNGFDTVATKSFHKFLEVNHIPSTVWTRNSAIGASMSTSVFDDLAASKHPIGAHLQKIQSTQDLHYYDNAVNGPRFMPHMNQQWFLENKTSWYQRYPHGHSKKLPVGREVLQYCNLVTYDALAALGTAGPEVLGLLGVLAHKSYLDAQRSRHKVVGPSKTETGVDKQNMTLALSALMKGSLWAVQNGFSSQY